MNSFTPTGLDQKQLNILKSILEIHLAEYPNARIFVFGSRATGLHRKYSDLDLWLEADTQISNETIQNLHDKFSDSDLSIMIDLVTPESCLEEYRANINEHKKLWLSLK